MINCNATGPEDVAITISWYHDDTLVTPASDPRVQISPSGSLTVSNATVSHSGEYTCNASTSYAFDVARVSVIVGGELGW